MKRVKIYIWPGSQVARQRFAKPLYVGANPAQALREARVLELVDSVDLKSTGDFLRVGSSPTPGTID